MSEVRVFLGGEGNNELGSRAGNPAYQTDDRPGVVQTLLCKVQADGWYVIGATIWKDIRKFRATGPTPAEERNVLGLVEGATRAGANVVAFVRDSDNDHMRPRAIDEAIEKAERLFPNVGVIGGTAIPVLEAWVLAMLGHAKTESLTKSAAQSRLASEGITRKDTEGMVSKVESIDLTRVPDDARGLRKWISSAERTLPPMVSKTRGDVQPCS